MALLHPRVLSIPWPQGLTPSPPGSCLGNVYGPLDSALPQLANFDRIMLTHALELSATEEENKETYTEYTWCILLEIESRISRYLRQMLLSPCQLLGRRGSI